MIGKHQLYVFNDQRFAYFLSIDQELSMRLIRTNGKILQDQYINKKVKASSMKLLGAIKPQQSSAANYHTFDYKANHLLLYRRNETVCNIVRIRVL